MTAYLELADYLLIAERELGLPAEAIASFDRIGLGSIGHVGHSFARRALDGRTDPELRTHRGPRLRADEGAREPLADAEGGNAFLPVEYGFPSREMCYC